VGADEPAGQATADGSGAAGRLPRGVIALGLVSLFMDVSSEMIHSTLPLFLTSVLGVSTLSVGFIEGVAEGTASIAKVFAGALSDRFGRRRPLVLLGYSLSAATKPLFAIASGLGLVLTARFADRIGKGIRGAPRDALLADLTPAGARGAAYGLRQAMDTVGAFAGPMLAVVLLGATGGSFRVVFWVATVPALLSVAAIVLGVREPDRPRTPAPGRLHLGRADVALLGARYWLVVAFAALLTLARFSEAFLLLRAASVGIAAAYVPLVLVVMNVCYAASAYPLGQRSDRGGARGVLGLGITLLVAADLVLAFASSGAAVVAGAALWGLHMGATQAPLSAVVATTAPEELRGTGFGVFNLASGGALLVASVLAGWLWSSFGARWTFLAGAAFSAVALAGLVGGARGTGDAPPRRAR